MNVRIIMLDLCTVNHGMFICSQFWFINNRFEMVSNWLQTINDRFACRLASIIGETGALDQTRCDITTVKFNI